MHESAGPYDKCIAASSRNRSQSRVWVFGQLLKSSWLKCKAGNEGHWVSPLLPVLMLMLNLQPPWTHTSALWLGVDRFIMTWPTKWNWIWSNDILCPYLKIIWSEIRTICLSHSVLSNQVLFSVLLFCFAAIVPESCGSFLSLVWH